MMRTLGCLSLPLVAIASMISSPVAAEEPEELAPEDYYRANPIPVPAEALIVDSEPEPAPAAKGTLFVNFDGAQLKAGNDNATTNTTQMPTNYIQLAYPAFGGGNQRAATLQATIKDWMPFNVLVTDVRPQSGAYTMCMTGPGKGGGLPNGVLGIAPLDCNDGQPSNVVYAFHSSNDGFSASTQATTISQEIAHSFGLEHVTQPSDIMNPYNAGGDPAFLDQCFGIDDGGQGILCGSQHAKFCGNGSSQNSYQELLDQFGASAPDLSPPTVSITSPTDGSVFMPGDSFDINVTAADDVGVTKVELFSAGMLVSADQSAPYVWPVTNIPAGSYSFQATAYDGANNKTMSAVVNFTVMAMDGGTTSGGSTGTGEPTTSTSTSTSGGTSDSGSGTGGSTTDESSSGGDPTDSDPTVGADDATASSALPPGYGDDLNDGSGFCAVGGRRDWGAGALVVVVAGVWRRRRSRS